ncbi:MAG: radical SAM protein, partial [bacterium]
MKQQNLYQKLDEKLQEQLREIAFDYRLTVQEFYQVVKAARDLQMWDRESLPDLWDRWARDTDNKEQLLFRLRRNLQQLRESETSYEQEIGSPDEPAQKGVELRESEKSIFGDCPVASEKTVCCNLRTIDMVENCPMGCSYCSIQTFYHDQFVFDENFSAKLNDLDLDSDQRYHICTGQSSDSLVWGNRFGVLEDLFEFARDHPNVSLEFKTKTNNVEYLVENRVPPNIFCSWSLNPPPVIENEEHFTASLTQRLEAARTIADQGIKVAFHLHPMVYYEGWREDYP